MRFRSSSIESASRRADGDGAFANPYSQPVGFSKKSQRVFVTAAHWSGYAFRDLNARVTPTSRSDAIALLTRRIEFHLWPRWVAFLIAAVTALCGFGFSALLWRFGVEEMTWRYPIAVMLSYVVLLLLLACWSYRSWSDGLQIDGGGYSPTTNRESTCSLSHESASGAKGGGGEFSGAGASDSFEGMTAASEIASASDSSSIAGNVLNGGLEAAFSAEEGAVVAVPLVLIVALLALFGTFAFGVISLVWNAPTLLAYLMIDAGTASVLYVYVRSSFRNAWISTALWKTLPTFIGLSAIGALVGFVFSWIDPTAITLFDVLTNRF